MMGSGAAAAERRAPYQSALFMAAVRALRARRQRRVAPDRPPLADRKERASLGSSLVTHTSRRAPDVAPPPSDSARGRDCAVAARAALRRSAVSLNSPTHSPYLSGGYYGETCCAFPTRAAGYRSVRSPKVTNERQFCMPRSEKSRKLRWPGAPIGAGQVPLLRCWSRVVPCSCLATVCFPALAALHRKW